MTVKNFPSQKKLKYTVKTYRHQILKVKSNCKIFLILKKLAHAFVINNETVQKIVINRSQFEKGLVNDFIK